MQPSFTTAPRTGTRVSSHDAKAAMKLAVMCCTSRIGNGKFAPQRPQQLHQGARAARRTHDAQHTERSPAGKSLQLALRRTQNSRLLWRRTSLTWLMMNNCVHKRSASAS